MTSGYDKRQRFSNRQRFLLKRDPRDSGVGPGDTSGSYALVSEEVVSFRDDVIEAKRVPEDEVDPFLAGYHRSPGGIADYFDPGRRLLQNMENSGLLTESDRLTSHSRGFIPDNGHPFSKTTHKLGTSARFSYHRVYNVSDAKGNYAYGINPAVERVQISTAAAGSDRYIFPVQGVSGTSKILRFNQGLPAPTSDDLAALGTRAITLSAPAVPEVNVTGILGELARDIPAFPGVTLLRSLQRSGAGDEYLNLVFGLIPTLGDAQNLAKILRSYTIRLHQLRRDNGRPVRRKWAFPHEQKAAILSGASGDILTDDSLAMSCGGGGFGFDLRRETGVASSGQHLTRNFTSSGSALFMREEKRTWFKGSFTYVLPEIPGFSSRIESYMVEMDRLLGLSLNPSVAWQLSPWSWLVDWFIDISTQMDALTVNFDDNRVLNYGYAMQEIERSVVAKVVFGKGTTEAVKAHSLDFLNTSLTSTYKRRIRANPYGFVLQSDGEFWSAYRLAILGALGLSRS